MPQAKLPDINAAWVRYRNYGLESIQYNNYPGAVAAINEINAMLPELYRVKIDTRQYKELEKDNLTVICTACKAETTPDKLLVYKMLMPMTINHHGKPVVEEVWTCTACRATNNLIKTRMIRKVKQKPFYHQVIPDPPDRKDGVLDRTHYHNDMVKWFFDALEELDHQLGKYREEYKPLDEMDEGGYFVGEPEPDD